MPSRRSLQDRLAQLFHVRGEIKQVIDQLEGNAQIQAVIGQRFSLLRRAAAHDRADAATGAEQVGGFAGDNLQMLLFGDARIADQGQLDQFTFSHFARGFGQCVQNIQIAFAQRGFKRRHIQPVAHQHGGFIAPLR